MAHDLVLKGRAFVDGCFIQTCIGIDLSSGKITAIGRNLRGSKTLDYGNRLILPGAIDPHVHFRDPGLTGKEDFHTGSLAAVAGGVTTVFDMPNTLPPTISLETLGQKAGLAKGKSLCDFGLYAAVTAENLDMIDDLAKNVVGFKIYIGATTGSLLFPEEKLEIALERIAKTGKIAVLHAEDNDCLDLHKRVEGSVLDHLDARPSECEIGSIKTILRVAERTGCRCHIAHVSSYEALEVLKGRPKNITCGVTPHHLFLNIGSDFSIPAHGKVNPPLRTEADNLALFYGLISGNVDIVESDHAPHTISDKEGDFSEAPSGMPGVETLLPLLLAKTADGELSLTRIVDATSARVAEIFNLEGKGKIATGYDADLLVVDMQKVIEVSSSDLHSKCGWTPFEGHHAIFPEQVFRRGEQVVEDREFTWNTNYGHNVVE